MDRFIAGADLASELDDLGEYTVKSKRDAEAVVRALGKIQRVPRRPEGVYRTSPLHRLVLLMQEPEGDDAIDVFHDAGAAELLRIYSASFPPEEDDDDDLPFMLKILVMYRIPEAKELLIRAALNPATSDGFVWSVIFNQLGDDHPHAEEIVTRLSDPLPPGFAAVALLDLANHLAINGRKGPHPFGNAAGVSRLEQFLRDRDPDKFSYAHSATAAIPFVEASARVTLLDLAGSHPDPAVQLESFWAAAKLGDARGIASLVQASEDPRRGLTPLRYLEEIGKLDAAPASTATPEYRALAEMADWLAHPMEYGSFPDSLRVYDTRELSWPPANDRRRLWLIAYTYEANEKREMREVGIGMVGSVTFALFDEVTADLSPEDIYGLHCAWELEMNDDPRSPDVQSAEAGRALLGI